MMLTAAARFCATLACLLAEETGLPVLVAEEPLTCVCAAAALRWSAWTAWAASSPASNLLSARAPGGALVNTA